ncbi:MAG: OsmC family protein [Flavobacteriaceae bacterium]|nr:OsmC family protein [Flavobacteriaceae bacterium]
MSIEINTVWKGNMQLESENPGGKFMIDAGPDDGGNGDGFRPKALMLSALAGCSGLDIAMLIKKMRLTVDGFEIKTKANLTDEHPKYYDKVWVSYHFYGKDLDRDKLQKIVDLSVDKYCGVMEMFRKFADVTIEVVLH